MSLFLKKFLFFCALVSTAAGQSPIVDSFAVSPLNPTISDSISLSIFANGRNCCTQFYYDPAIVTLINDSTIMLHFTTFLAGACPCPSNPATPVLAYKRGPLPVGNYSVYEQYQSCTGQVCPYLLMQLLIGKFTVSQGTAVLFRQKPATKENIGKISGNVRVYDIRGAIVSSNLTGAQKHTSGVYFIKPIGRQAVKMELLY
jgi:hypothetical protein